MEGHTKLVLGSMMMTLALGQYCCCDCGGHSITKGYEQFRSSISPPKYCYVGVPARDRTSSVVDVMISMVRVADELAICMGNAMGL